MVNALGRTISVCSVLRFVLPSIIMMVVMSMYTVVDAVFVARLIGTDAFSAVNIIYPLVSVIIALGTMFGTGATALVAAKLGEGRQREANENLSFILLTAVAAGIVISLVVWCFLDSIIVALGANAAIYAYCHDYAMALLPFLPWSILQIAFQSLFVANGKPHIGLAITVFGGVSNIVLDYVFIAIMDMGISGAAVATGIGYMLPALYGVGYFLWKRNANLHFVRPRADWKALAKAVTNGSSEMVSYISASVTTFLFNVTMMRYLGQDGVAAIAIMLYLDFLLIAVSLGYAMGVAPLFSFNYGSGRKDALRGLYRISIGFYATLGLGTMAGALLFAPQLVGVFAPESSPVFTMALEGIKIFAISYLCMGYNIFSSAMFTAFGNGGVSALLAFMRTLVFLSGSIIGLTFLFGVTGTWFAVPVAEALSCVLAGGLSWKFRKVYGYGGAKSQRCLTAASLPVEQQ